MRSKRCNKFALFGLGLSFLCFLSHSHASVSGTYILDKATLRQSLDARFAKLPSDRKAFVGMAKAMFVSLEMKLTLNQGGKAQTLASMKVMGHAQTYHGNGKWEQKGNTVTISTQVTSKKRPAFAQTMICEITSTGMSCHNPKMKKHPLPFLRGNANPSLAPAAQRPTPRAANPSPTPAKTNNPAAKPTTNAR